MPLDYVLKSPLWPNCTFDFGHPGFAERQEFGGDRLDASHVGLG